MLQLKFPQGIVVTDTVKCTEKCRGVTGKEEIEELEAIEGNNLARRPREGGSF